MTAIEKFTFVAVCPACGRADTHGMRKAKHRPPLPTGDDPRARHQRLVSSMLETLDRLSLGPSSYDPDGAAVMRQCECGHEWPQR